MGLFQKIFGTRDPETELVRVAVSRHQPEGEFLLQLLKAAGIPAMFGRTRGFDVPDMLAAGPRDIMVPAAYELAARDVLQPVLEELSNLEPSDDDEDSGVGPMPI
jgi:hypothetical protein